MLVASAGFWSLVMVRQSRHAPNYPSFPLGTYKVRLGAEALLANINDRVSGKAVCLLVRRHQPGLSRMRTIEEFSDGTCNMRTDEGMKWR